MKSVPPRGSGWVSGFSISDCRLQIGFIARRQLQIGNRQSANQETHPLPRGGTDLISTVRVLLLPTTREQVLQLQPPAKERLCFMWRRPLTLPENKKLVPAAVGARSFIHFIKTKQRICED